MVVAGVGRTAGGSAEVDIAGIEDGRRGAGFDASGALLDNDTASGRRDKSSHARSVEGRGA